MGAALEHVGWQPHSAKTSDQALHSSTPKECNGTLQLRCLVEHLDTPPPPPWAKACALHNGARANGGASEGSGSKTFEDGHKQLLLSDHRMDGRLVDRAVTDRSGDAAQLSQRANRANGGGHTGTAVGSSCPTRQNATAKTTGSIKFFRLRYRPLRRLRRRTPFKFRYVNRAPAQTCGC